MSLPVRSIRSSVRSAFPYKDSNVTFLVADEGLVLPVEVNEDTVRNVVNSDTKLFAIWPGKHRSDLFEIDKFELAKAFLSE